MANYNSLNKKYGARIAERDIGGWMCAYCYRKLDPDHAEMVMFEYTSLYRRVHMTHYSFYLDAPTVDHVVPRYHGGLTHMDNLVLACKSCNSRKNRRPL
jgi:5-methylcytosine-specific restriction endonuclease McrA